MAGRAPWIVLALAMALGACAPKPPAPVVYKGSAASPTRPERVVVKSGDSVYAIAQRYNVSLRALIDANDLRPPYRLSTGQSLALPRTRVHRVSAGDTLYAISRRYGVDMTTLARANRLASPYRLRVGQDLRIPSTGAEPPPSPTATGEPSVAVVSRASPTTSTTRASPITTAPPPPKPRASTSVASAPTAPSAGQGRFAWPVKGKIIDRFGAKSNGLRNDGINIAAPRGTPVRAAADGVVAYTGNELRGYGNLILLRHAGGWITAYAHNREILVARGDRVRRGQMIARVGSSGSVSTPQAHFELRRGSEAVDPLKHLARF